MSPKKDFKIDYQIKLLSGNNVVLVEATGYESEIFVPEISNGRINIQNIIPNRRCTCESKSNLISTNVEKLHGKENRKKTRAQQPQGIWPTNEKHMSSLPKTLRLGAGDENIRHSSLTYNSPTSTLSPIHLDVKQSGNKENITPNTRLTSQRNLGNDDTLKFQKFAKKNRCTAPYNTKSVYIQCNPNILHVGSGDSDYALRDIANLSKKPLLSLESTSDVPKDPIKRHPTIAPLNFSKWRKGITPLRTCSRHGMGVLSMNSNIKKSRTIKKVSSATQGMKGPHKVEGRRHKLMYDQKMNISPYTMRMLQRSTTRLIGRNVTPTKPQKNTDANKPTAFELLTSANRSRIMTSKLEKQFKKTCINNASSPCTKYKLLCKIPLLNSNERSEGLKRKSQGQELKSHLDIDNNIQTANIIAAAMTEKACVPSIQKSDYVSNIR